MKEISNIEAPTTHTDAQLQSFVAKLNKMRTNLPSSEVKKKVRDALFYIG